MINIDKEQVKRAMQSHGICVVIPTYNNAGTLKHVIRSVLEYTYSVIVVNDGSRDDTPLILSEFGHKVIIIEHPENKGKGCALKSGFSKAKAEGFKYAITIDSDGQHYAEDIPLFVKAIIENPGSMIIGERDLTNVAINVKSSFANKFSNFWFCVQTGRRLSDTQTGYRAYPLDKLYGLGLLTSRYEAELALLVFAAWYGVKIVSISIRVYYPHQSERVSHFRPGLDFTRISILNTILCVGAVIYGLPVRLCKAISQKKLFNKEWKWFTHKQGIRKEAASTLGRILRSLYGIVYFVFWSVGVFTPMAFILFSVGHPSENKRLKFHVFLQWISKFLTKRFPGADVSYENTENEYFSKPSLIICNHQSHLDLPVLMSIHPKLIFLTNDWVWNNFFYGRIIHTAEFLPVSAGLDNLLPQLLDLKNRGYSIVVFPEGTRSADCSILRFHQGAFYLANELGLDIVPMVLHGAGHYLPKKDFMFRKGKITLRILDRVPFSEISQLMPMRQASKFRSLIKAEYINLAENIETAEYFKSLVLYKYAYRGWPIVYECKRILKVAGVYADCIDNEEPTTRIVRFINSGLGVIPLLYALVNENVEVYAYEEDIHRHGVASETGGIPSNLHFIHAVWPSDYELEGKSIDKTFVIHSRNENILKYTFLSKPIIIVNI